MNVSFVVPAYNEEKLITSVLAAIRAASGAFSQRGWKSELIVCDNNSTDRTAELARAAQVKVVFEPVNQISKARNRGAEAATGDWLVFIDGDSYPSIELMEEVARIMESGRYVGGGSTIRLEGATGVPRLMNNLWNAVSRVAHWAAGSFVFCETRAFRALGGFDELLYASEEIEFSQRLKHYASEHGRNTVILTRHPLATSARKTVLCKRREYGWLLWQTLWHRGSNLRRREACPMWYDGRR